jgi:hypothetical protein
MRARSAQPARAAYAWPLVAWRVAVCTPIRRKRTLLELEELPLAAGGLVHCKGETTRGAPQASAHHARHRAGIGPWSERACGLHGAAPRDVRHVRLGGCRHRGRCYLGRWPFGRFGERCSRSARRRGRQRFVRLRQRQPRGHRNARRDGRVGLHRGRRLRGGGQRGRMRGLLQRRRMRAGRELDPERKRCRDVRSGERLRSRRGVQHDDLAMPTKLQ